MRNLIEILYNRLIYDNQNCLMENTNEKKLCDEPNDYKLTLLSLSSQ